MSTIGLMDPAYFVGKNQLLKWLNDFFEAGVTKVEQMSTGAIHCQILDAIYPDSVPLYKVNFDAKTQPEFVNNWKVLQSVFDAHQISKHVDVPKLINSKFQDNLEFLQWMKSFFDKNYQGQPYNAKERRDQARAGYKKTHKFAKSGNNINNALPSKPKAAPAEKSSSKPSSKPSSSHGAPAKTTTRSTSSTTASASQINELRLTIENLEKERNFYFGKLRDIEILCQEDELSKMTNDQIKEKILSILYQTDDQFQQPDDDENKLSAPESQQHGLLSDEDTQQTF